MVRKINKIATVSGKVIRGLGIGKTLGWPTLNIHPRRIKKSMRYGIYAVRVETQAGKFAGALFYGPRYMHDAPVSLEVYCIGLKHKLYGKNIKIEFFKRIRAVKHFKSTAELKRSIAKDVEIAKKIMDSLL